jgi:hypothetical protein
MARLKKASRPLTPKQQIDKALELLVLSRKNFKLLALSQDEREQCCMHIAELADTMASVRADAERPRPTRATYRAALAALKRHKKTSEAVTAAGGGVASLDLPLHPDAVLRGGIDHQIAWLESRLRPQRLAVRAFPSPKKTAVALAYELVTGWGGGARAAKAYRDGLWSQLAAAIYGEGSEDIDFHLEMLAFKEWVSSHQK